MILLKAIGLFIVITFGVASGNLLSNFVTVYLAAEALKQSTAAMEQKNKESAERRKIQEAEQAKIDARKQEERRKAQEQQGKDRLQDQQVKQRLNETCQYWIDQFKRTKNEVDKSHRDISCRQAGRPFN